MSRHSALYIGSVMHRRQRPRTHYLRHGAFWMLLDLDEIETLARELRLFSHNRLNVLSFHDADHGDGSSSPLRGRIDRLLAAEGVGIDGGAIRLLCMPRVLGYGFNPLSIYFCHRHDGTLAAVLYEVHNTFGERHSYLIPVDADSSCVRQRCDKRFYVSPFMDMDISYEFRVAPPADRVSIAIRACDQAGPVIFAALAGERRELTDRALARLLATHPLLTLKVIGAIHWHALLLWWKGVALRPRPRPPARDVTLVGGRHAP